MARRSEATSTRHRGEHEPFSEGALGGDIFVAEGGDGSTQFARAMGELNIDVICANTPQAKGRGERAHLTLQDRLVKELRLQGISSIEAGNAFLPLFMAHHNRRFACEPQSAHDAHRPVGTHALDDVFQ